MDLKVYFPTGILKNFVDSITYLSGDGTGVAFQRMYQVIIINMGTNFGVSGVYDAHPAKKEQTETIWINGKQEVPLMIENTGTTKMYAIGIRGGMLPYLASLPAQETNDLAVGAQNWTSREIYSLREQLLECNDVTAGFVLIEQYLTKQLLRKDFSSLEKIKWLDNAMNTYSVDDLCRTLGVTRKKLRSEAQHYFGGSVKSLQGIIRFNNTLHDMANNQNRPLSAIDDYYDQAHFINDFKARAGITPLQYKKLCLRYPAIKYTPNFIPVTLETFLQFISTAQV